MMPAIALHQMHEYKDGSHGIYFESTPLKICTAIMVGCSLVGILTTNMQYLQEWINTNREPAQVLTCTLRQTLLLYSWPGKAQSLRRASQ